MMKRFSQFLTLAAVATAFFLGANPVQAQGRGNFDPAQFQQRMMERYKEALEVKSDAEWKIIEERIQKVMDARREVGFGGMGRGMMGRPPRAGDNQGDQAQNNRRRGPGGEPSAAAQELQQALDSKASADQIKAKLAKFREDRKQKQASLEKAQDELKKVLSVRQEAISVTMGLLN